ncbi:glycosyltransferase [Cohnella sp. AR92]|uniref:glycosyltransferase n=1 Tax=Cohnella sp. AR92 TaxID=648716 RepID=UPI00192DE1B1|nr:glycosyltransferase [Cohnella sp. AR92]
MNIAVMTLFNGLSKTYSLVSVVEEHLNMLVSAGMNVRLLVSEDCPEEDGYGIYLDERVRWVRIANRLRGEQIHWRDYTQATGRVHSSFFAEADAIAASMYEALKDVEVCFLHDILYQGWHLVHNVALRLVQPRLPHIRFLAMSHSIPAARPFRMTWPLAARFIPLPNTIYLYPTESGLPALAKQYSVPLEQCRAVYNSLNLLAEASEDAVRLSERTDLVSPDVLVVSPGRLTPGKQLEKIAALAGAVGQASGLTVKVVYCDFPSLDIDPDAYKKRIVEEGGRFGLAEGQIVFTSDLGWKDGLPHRAVMDLFALSNLFICSSYSESFGLIVLEAASRGNFLVLNQAVPALEELGERFGAYFVRWNARNFGYDTSETYQPSEQSYLLEHAEAIVRKMENNEVLRAKRLVRQRYHSGWIWENQLKPLLESSLFSNNSLPDQSIKFPSGADFQTFL